METDIKILNNQIIYLKYLLKHHLENDKIFAITLINDLEKLLLETIYYYIIIYSNISAISFNRIWHTYICQKN